MAYKQGQKEKAKRKKKETKIHPSLYASWGTVRDRQTTKKKKTRAWSQKAKKPYKRLRALHVSIYKLPSPTNCATLLQKFCSRVAEIKFNFFLLFELHKHNSNPLTTPSTRNVQPSIVEVGHIHRGRTAQDCSTIQKNQGSSVSQSTIFFGIRQSAVDSFHIISAAAACIRRG